METTTKELTLQELASMAYRQRQQEEERQSMRYRAETEQRALDAFRRLAGREPDDVDGNRVTADGIALRYVTSYGSGCLYLEGECPDCGETTWGNMSIYDPSHLGQALAEPFEPNYDHRCPPAGDEQELSLEERQVKALEKIASALTAMVV